MKRTIIAALALAANLFAVEFDYDRFDNYEVLTSQMAFKDSNSFMWFKELGAGDAMITRKTDCVTWTWVDGNANSVDRWYMNNVGEYVHAGSFKCSFTIADVQKVAKAFFVDEDFTTKFGRGGVISEEVVSIDHMEELIDNLKEYTNRTVEVALRDGIGTGWVVELDGTDKWFTSVYDKTNGAKKFEDAKLIAHVVILFDSEEEGKKWVEEYALDTYSAGSKSTRGWASTGAHNAYTLTGFVQPPKTITSGNVPFDNVIILKDWKLNAPKKR